MAYDENWEIDQYRSAHETDEQWDLKRKFMEMHRGTMPEDRVVCLAQVLANVEFLGCRYPTETMSTLAELSRGLVEDYREKQRGKLQRTFVKASDAAGARYKQGRKLLTESGETASPIPSKVARTSEQNEGVKVIDEQESKSMMTEKKNNSLTTNEPRETQPDIQEMQVGEERNESEVVQRPTKNKKKKQKLRTTSEPECPQPETVAGQVEGNQEEAKNQIKVAQQATNKKKKKKTKAVANEEVQSVEEKLTPSTSQGRKGSYHLPAFVLLDRELINGTELTASSLLQRSCTLNQCPLEYVPEDSKGDDGKMVKLLINGQTIASASAANIKLAKQEAARKAVEQLRQTQFCVIEKQVGSGKDPLRADDILQSEQKSDNLSDSNVGAKLMRLMGWSGGGVGKTAGRTDIVSTQVLFGRSGLGYTGPVDATELRKKAQHFMAKYVNSNQEHDLIFSSDLTPEERKAIHMAVHRFSGQLKSQSYGSGQDRYLMVSRKLPKSQLVDMARHLWEQQLRTQQTNPKFRVIAPLNSNKSATC